MSKLGDSLLVEEEREVMKQIINLLGVIFLIVSLVVIAVAAITSFFPGDDGVQRGDLIIQLVIAICAAVIGVVHLVIAAILSKRA